MQEVAQQLTKLGHTITSRWIWGHHRLHDGIVGTEEGLALQQEFAMDDYEDLRDAHCIVAFAEPQRTPTRGGRLVEFGLAIGWNKRIVKVGGHETVFDALPMVEHVPDANTLYSLLT